MIAFRATRQKPIWPGYYIAVKVIKAFPKTGFYLYHSMVDRTERGLGREKANHLKKEERKKHPLESFHRDEESELEVECDPQ